LTESPPPPKSSEESSADLGEAPTDLAFGAETEWAVIQSVDCVAKIDPATLDVSDAVSVGDTPSSISAGQGMMWVANQGDGTVTSIDTSTNEATTYAIGGTPTAIAVNKSGVWVTDPANGTVTRLDPASGDVVATIPVTEELTSIAADENSVWVGSALDGKIYRIDVASNSVTNEVLVTGAPQLTIGDGYVWVMAGATGEVLKLDPNTGDVLVRREILPGGAPVSVTFDLAVGDNSVWVLGGGTKLHELDKGSLQPIGTTSLPEGAATVDAGGGDVYIASGDTIEQMDEDAVSP
jgi:streptogramin lyase